MPEILKPFVDYVNETQLKMYGICVQQHGKLIDSFRWVPDEAHQLYSMSKSYTSIAVGMAIEEGLFSLTDRVVSFFPDLLPDNLSPHMEEMTVRHLLTMASGILHPVLFGRNMGQEEEKDWARIFLSAVPDIPPGTSFVYDSGCTYMLSRIIAKTSGQDLLDYLKPRLFDPLGIENPVWDRCPLGYSQGGSGLHLRTSQSLPFGQMLLQNGVWEGKQIVSAGWIREATRFQIATDNCGFYYDKALGYGYQFWLAREGAYRASGAYGQGCMVIPSRDAVITFNANQGNMQPVLEGLWDLLIPLLK